MNETLDDEYNNLIMATVERIYEALDGTASGIAIYALLFVLAHRGTQSTVTREEFLAFSNAQLQQLMDVIPVSDNPLH